LEVAVLNADKLVDKSCMNISLHPLDWLVIALYMTGIFAIAWYAMRRVKDTGGLLLGKRKLGGWMMAAASFAGGTNANHPLSVASATFEKGVSGIWISLTWMLITPFFWLYPPALRRLRIVTMIDIVRMRYGGGMSMLFKLVSLVATPMAMGLGIKSGAIVIEVMTGGAISGVWAQAFIAIPTLIYALMGGVVAAYMTDIVQGLLIIVLSFLLVPFAIHAAGGVAALDAAVDDSLTQLWSQEMGAFGPWWIFWFGVGVTFSAVLSSAGGAAAAKNETVARMQIFGSVTKRFCTVGWGLVGFFGIVLYVAHPAVMASSNNVFPVASMELLPVILRGLMVACIISAVMSSLDASILNYGGVVVNNIYQEHFVPKASSSHYLLMTRIFASGGLLVGWWIASGIDSIVQFTKVVEPVNGLIGITILVALMWRRVTAWGAIAAVAVMIPLFVYTAQTSYPNGMADLPTWLRVVVTQMEAFYNWTGAQVAVFDNNKLDVPYMYPIYLVPGLLTMIVVSLLTRQHNERAVAEFYARLDTPVGEEQRLRDAGFEADQLENLDNERIVGIGSKTGHQRLFLADMLYLPMRLWRKEVTLKDYAVDLWGIAGSVTFVIVFLLALQWLIAWLF
jgi:Na+/proline symporter